MTHSRPINGRHHHTTGDGDGSNWRQSAACRGHEDIFDHIIDNSGSKTAYDEAARAICAGCNVRKECRAEADRWPGYTLGMWGGEIIGRRGRPRTAAVCGTRSGYFAHRHKDQPPCPDCKAAHAAYEQARLQKKWAA